MRLLPLALLFCAGCPWIPPGQHFQRQGETRGPPDPPDEETEETGEPAEPACDYPKAPAYDLVPGAPVPFAPSWLGFEWQMFSDEEGLHDFSWIDGDYPAFFQVNVYGPEGDYLCAVRFNGQRAEPAPDALLPPGGPLAAGWFIDPEAGRGPQSDCPPLDPEVFGTESLAELLSQGNWGFGIGEMGPLAELLAESLAETWEERASSTLGGYISYDGSPPRLTSYDMAFQAECGQTVVADGAPVRQPQSPSDLPEATHVGETYFLWPSTDFLPASCERASSELPDDWAPGDTALTTATYVALHFDFATAPEGGIVDYWADTDLDGTLEPQDAVVVLNLYDDAVALLCSFRFDAERAVEINAGLLPSLSGQIWRAWTLDLVGGTSDCPGLDPLIYGTDDPRDLFGAWSFSFGVGELQENRDALAERYGADWTVLEPLMFGVYVSLDGQVADEQGYGVGYDLDACLSLDSNLGAHVTGVIEGGFATNLYGLPFTAWVLAPQE